MILSVPSECYSLVVRGVASDTMYIYFLLTHRSACAPPPRPVAESTGSVEKLAEAGVKDITRPCDTTPLFAMLSS